MGSAGRVGGDLVLLCGRSFSGKSTTARHLAAAFSAEVLSLDAINSERGLHGGRGIPVEEWVTTNAMARDRAVALLRRGRSVIVDDTSSLRFLRDEWRRVAHSVGAAFALVFVDTDVAVIRERVALNRAAPVRPDVLDRVLDEHLAGFEDPDVDEPAVRTTDGLDSADLLSRVRAALGAARPT